MGSLCYAAPEKVRAQERNGPAVMVLLIDGPLRPQVVDEDQPVAGKGEEIEEGRWKTGPHLNLKRAWNHERHELHEGTEIWRNQDALQVGEQYPPHNPLMFRVLSVFRGLNCRFWVQRARLGARR